MIRILSLTIALVFVTASNAGQFYGTRAIDDPLTFTTQIHDPSTGAHSDADSAPTYRIYEDETGTPILTGTMALLDDANTTGLYSEQITLSAANGFEKAKSYTIRILATVGGTTGSQTHNFQIGGSVDVRYWGTSATPVTNLNTVFNTDFANNYNTTDDAWAVDVEFWSAEPVLSLLGGLIPVDVQEIESTDATDVLGVAQTADHTVSIAAILADSNELQTDWTNGGRLDLLLDGTKLWTDRLGTAMELDGAVYRFTTNALEQAPSGGGGGGTDWTADERTAIRTILGIPASGTTPTDPTDGILDDIRDSTSAVTDINDETVPEQRAWVLVDGGEGLVGESEKSLLIGPSPTFAIDFRNDIPVGGKINIAGSPTIVSGTPGGITFGTVGKEDSQVKFRITGVTAGTYEISVEVTYDSGATAKGIVTLIVAP